MNWDQFMVITQNHQSRLTNGSTVTRLLGTDLLSFLYSTISICYSLKLFLTKTSVKAKGRLVIFLKSKGDSSL